MAESILDNKYKQGIFITAELNSIYLDLQSISQCDTVPMRH